MSDKLWRRLLSALLCLALLLPAAALGEDDTLLTPIDSEVPADDEPADDAAEETPGAYFTFDQTELTLAKGKKVTLKPVAVGFTLPKKTSAFTWSTSKSSIVTVSKKGQVTAKGGGEGKVWCSVTVDGVTYTAECSVTVTVVATGVSAPSKETLLMAGQTARPKFAVKPSDTSDPRLSYASSDEAVATVDEDGVVTAVAPGTCKITASTMDGSNKRALPPCG